MSKGHSKLSAWMRNGIMLVVVERYTSCWCTWKAISSIVENFCRTWFFNEMNELYTLRKRSGWNRAGAGWSNMTPDNGILLWVYDRVKADPPVHDQPHVQYIDFMQTVLYCMCLLPADELLFKFLLSIDQLFEYNCNSGRGIFPFSWSTIQHV